MAEVVHLVVGPEQHGVVRHGAQIAGACGHPLVRVREVPQVPPPGDVVHLPFTDRLFGRDLEQASAAFRRLRDEIASSGAMLSVTLHDVPHDDSPLQRRRLGLYREVMDAARGVVVNSRLELSLVERYADEVHSLRVVLLPVIDPVHRRRPAGPIDGPTQVAVLGFVYPDRGYEDVLAALPAEAQLVALGRPSDGHEDLAAGYARSAGPRWRMTGYLDDEELAERLCSIAVPVAPNRRITASGSINSWVAHGRRPLVPDSPYAREIAADRPGTVTLYDADDPDALRAAIAAAIADPGSTWLSDGIDRGPDLDEAAAAYGDHLVACRPLRAVRMPAGWVVPGNRWDLLDGLEPDPPRVSVVVPYFEAQPQLDRTLAALAVQTHPADRLEIVVADDGSPTAPDVRAAGDVPTRVVRQDDRGFRAAAARNLGAAEATGDVLVFLDADTMPEPDFVARLTRLPALCPDVVAVGRRRHADFAHDPPRPLPEPQWLSAAYAASGDLLHADARSYRFVISAVLAITRRLFDELGGFDERFVGYGGEDWELAHRAWVAGALFAHVPDAVAWHDGPDWSARPDAKRPDAKNAEALALATLLPDPAERGSGQWTPYPAAVVSIGPTSAAALLAVARTAFASGADVGIWADGVSGPHSDLVVSDARLHLGPPPPDVLARARWLVEVTGCAGLGGLPGLLTSADRRGEVRAGGVRVRSAHAWNRARRWWPEEPEARSAQLFGRHDRSAAESSTTDLGAVLRRC